ncbi:hypothetical protein LNA01_14950 [Companilactobacillus nantensis]|nr:hypothetical protein LNA01_14950 [Companilactobacillus nantensis]
MKVFSSDKIIIIFLVTVSGNQHRWRSAVGPVRAKVYHLGFELRKKREFQNTSVM